MISCFDVCLTMQYTLNPQNSTAFDSAKVPEQFSERSQMVKC